MCSSDDDASPVHACKRCGAPLVLHDDPHLEVTWKEGPPPDRDEMAFDDWFSTGAYLCADCQTKFESFLAGDR